MESFGFYFDMNRCIGCKACQIACKEHHKLPNDVFFRKAGTHQLDTKAGTAEFNYSGACNHCNDPACALACTTRALHFGRIADLEREYGPGMYGTVSFLPDASQTRPSIIAHKPKELSVAEANCQILSTEVREESPSFV